MTLNCIQRLHAQSSSQEFETHFKLLDHYFSVTVTSQGNIWKAEIMFIQSFLIKAQNTIHKGQFPLYIQTPLPFPETKPSQSTTAPSHPRNLLGALNLDLGSKGRYFRFYCPRSLFPLLYSWTISLRRSVCSSRNVNGGRDDNSAL